MTQVITNYKLTDNRFYTQSFVPHDQFYNYTCSLHDNLAINLVHDTEPIMREINQQKKADDVALVAVYNKQFCCNQFELGL